MNIDRPLVIAIASCLFTIVSHSHAGAVTGDGGHSHAHALFQFDLRSVHDGNWSDAKTWSEARVPTAGDRVLVSRGTRVIYDGVNKDVVRLIQVVGTLVFAR